MAGSAQLFSVIEIIETAHASFLNLS